MKQQRSPSPPNKGLQKQRLIFGRTAPLLARQRLLPMELHARLMPFDRRKHAEIPRDIEPPPIPSFKNRKLGQSTAAVDHDDGVGGAGRWHSSKSISWSVRTADIANKLAEAKQQREDKKQHRLDNNLSVAGAPATTAPRALSPASLRSAHARATAPRSPDAAAGDSPPKMPPSALLSPEKHAVAAAARSGGDGANPRGGAPHDAAGGEPMDPRDVAKALVTSKLQARAAHVARPVSAAISGRAAQLEQQHHQQQQPSRAVPEAGTVRPSTAGRSAAQRERAAAFAPLHEGHLAEADLMDAAWRLAAHGAPNYGGTGRGRAAYPRYDDFGHEYRDDASIAVEHSEGVGATAAGEATSHLFRYFGPYVGNRKHGLGRYIVGDDGSSYLGEFRDGEMRGSGVRYLGDGTVLQGGFVDGELDGDECVVLAPSGERYEGGYRGGRRHGHGELHWRSEAFVPPPPPLATATPAPPPSAPQRADDGIPNDDGNGGGDDDDDCDACFDGHQRRANANAAHALHEEAFHTFVGEFADGDPCGAGVQTTVKTRRDPATGEVRQHIVDRVDGAFAASGPQGRCRRSIVRTFFGDTGAELLAHLLQPLSARALAQPNKHGKKTVRREVFDGGFEAGREHCASCLFRSSTTAVDYCGPMQNGMRAHIPNTLVLEGARVLPLENAPKAAAAAASPTTVAAASASTMGSPSPTALTAAPSSALAVAASAAEFGDAEFTSSSGAVLMPSLPSGQAATTNSGRRNAPVTQDAVSWAQPLLATAGTEVIQLRLCTAYLAGFAADEQYTQRRLERLLQQNQQNEGGNVSSSAQQQQQAPSPVRSSLLQTDETGRKLTVRVFAADAKAGVAGAARALYHALGLDDVFLDALADSIDPDLEDENVEFDIAAAHAMNKLSGRGRGPQHQRGPAKAVAAAAAAGGLNRRGSMVGGGGGGNNSNSGAPSIFALHPRTLLAMAFDSFVARKGFVDAVRAHRDVLRRIAAGPPTAEEEAAAAIAHHQQQQQLAATLTPRKAKQQQQQHQAAAMAGSPATALRRPSSASSSPSAGVTTASAGGHLQHTTLMSQYQQLLASPAALAALGGCSKEPVLQVSREHLANTVQCFQRLGEELLDIAEDLVLTSMPNPPPSGLSSQALNNAVFDDVRKEINPPAPPAGASVAAGTITPGGGGGGGHSPHRRASSVPPLAAPGHGGHGHGQRGHGSGVAHHHQTLRSRVGVASQGTFVQSQVVTTERGRAVATVQLAPLQATAGDLLFIVVNFADDNIVLPSPGGDPARFFSAPLVVPLVIGKNGGQLTPRKK